MNATTVAIDLAKNVFELAAADERGKVVERARLTRGQLERWFENRSVRLVVMEACATAHHWARRLRTRGIDVRLLPAKYVRAYVRRNKTDAADAMALLEAARASDITPVAVKSIEQQALQGLHRLRSGWMSTRTRRINTLRGLCREFGIDIPVGAARGLAQIARLLAEERSPIPALLRAPMRLALEEIRLMEARLESLERELAALARQSEACQALASSAASPSAATATCERCSRTAPARCCVPPSSRSAPAASSIGCEAGRSRSRRAPTTTRQPARSPISSPASPGPSG